MKYLTWKRLIAEKKVKRSRSLNFTIPTVLRSFDQMAIAIDDQKIADHSCLDCLQYFEVIHENICHTHISHLTLIPPYCKKSALVCLFFLFLSYLNRGKKMCIHFVSITPHFHENEKVLSRLHSRKSWLVTDLYDLCYLFHSNIPWNVWPSNNKTEI